MDRPKIHAMHASQKDALNCVIEMFVNDRHGTHILLEKMCLSRHIPHPAPNMRHIRTQYFSRQAWKTFRECFSLSFHVKAKKICGKGKKKKSLKCFRLVWTMILLPRELDEVIPLYCYYRTMKNPFLVHPSTLRDEINLGNDPDENDDYFLTNEKRLIWAGNKRW